MNRKEAAEVLPFIKAFSEGKEIQTSVKGKPWEDLGEDIAFYTDDKYRIKPESEYRPFKDAEECWAEMQKHQPFGWVKVDNWYCTMKEIRPTCAFCNGGGDVFHFEDMVKQITFVDGTPFGVKVEE